MPLATNSVLNKFTATLAFLFCSFFLSACSTTKTPATFSPQAAETDRAVVYIYRPDAMANAVYSPGLNIDNEFKLYVKNSVSSRLALAPGEHLFEFQNDKNYSELKPLSLIFKTGKVYFIRVNSSLKIRNTASYQPYARSFSLTPVDEQQAVKEIAACCIDSNKSLNKEKKATSSEKKTDPGFSVDKTQNPFSH